LGLDILLKIKKRRSIMSDDLTKRRPQDSSKVNVHEPWEVNWWCDELKCTKAQLVAAVNAVGVSAAAVRRYLGK
jgi:hypothetical protein